MSRRKISEQTSLPELAALVSEALERAGIAATLSGACLAGALVSLVASSGSID
jgi:galactokinase